MKKYEFVEEPITAYAGDGTPLRRIRALVDIPAHQVKAGDLGGFIEVEDNLPNTLDSASWVGREARVWGEAQVLDKACVLDQARVFGKSLISRNAMIAGSAVISGNVVVLAHATVCGFARVEGSAVITGYATVNGAAGVCDEAVILDNAFVTGYAQIHGKSRVGGYASISDNGVITSNADYLTIGPNPITGGYITAFADSKTGIRVHIREHASSLEDAKKRLMQLAKPEDKEYVRTLLKMITAHFKNRVPEKEIQAA